MTATRRFILFFMLFSQFFILSAQKSPPLSIRQPFDILSKIENEALRSIDTTLAVSEGYTPINSTLRISLGNIIARLSASPDVGKGEVAVPLAIARTFQANDGCLYGDFKGSMQLADAAIEALQIHARDTGAIYTLALAYGIKAYDLENLFDLEAALLERDKGIEVFKRIGYTSNIIAERLNKAKIYADLGDEKASFKELDAYNKIRDRFKIQDYFKQDIFAITVLAPSLIEKGNKHRTLGEFEEAEATYKKALNSLHKSTEMLNQYKNLFSLNEFAMAQHTIELNTAAIYANAAWFNQGDSILAHVARAESAVPTNEIDVSMNITKSMAWILKGDTENAQKNIQTALAALIDPKTDVKDIFSTPSVNISNISFLQLAPNLYSLKGRLLKTLYDSSEARKKPDLRYLSHAFFCFQQSQAAIDSLRMGFSTDAMMQSVVKRFSSLHPLIMSCVVQLYQKTQNSAYLDTMLRLSEQHKSFSLRQTIYSRANRERYTGKTLELYNEEQQLKRALIIAQNAFSSNQTSSFLQKRDAAHANYRQFKDNLRIMPPNTEGARYYAERFADSVPSIKDIQRDWLKTKQGEVPRVFLSYIFSPTQVIALLVTPTTAKPYSKTINQTTWELLRRFNASIESEKNFPNAAAYQLYETLLKDILLDVPQNAHLIISAEGSLLRLPFEALLTQEVQNNDNKYPQMPFLIKKHRVSYLPSLTTQMWLRTFHAAATPMNPKIGIVKGYYTQGKYENIDYLLNSADSVATYYDKSAVIFDNDKKVFAAKEKDTENLTDLFFALHGEASAENTLDYALILRDSSATDAGKLTVSKIKDMRFKKLNSAVFGACETQHGELDLGEGMFSIARAFQSLGCRHIIGTLNNVSVEPTACLFNNFYFQHKSRQKSFSEALHEAKLGYLKTMRKEECHPYFWANIVYLGDE